jgi:hypothetical protein
MLLGSSYAKDAAIADRAQAADPPKMAGNLNYFSYYSLSVFSVVVKYLESFTSKKFAPDFSPCPYLSFLKWTFLQKIFLDLVTCRRNGCQLA